MPHCSSSQHTAAVPDRQLTQGETSHHPLHRIPRLADSSPRGWSLQVLTVLQVCMWLAESSFWWRASFPLPTRLPPAAACAASPIPVPGSARRCGAISVFPCVWCVRLCVPCACLDGKEAAQGGGRDDFEGGLRKGKKRGGKKKT